MQTWSAALGTLLLVAVVTRVAVAEPTESHLEALAFHGASVGASGRPLDGVERCTVSAASVGMATRLRLGDFGPESARGGFVMTLDGALRRDALLGVHGGVTMCTSTLRTWAAVR
jgi:hypothetical protein